MQFISDAIQNGDYCSLLFFSVIVMIVGGRMVDGRPAIRLWGLRLAAVAFILFAVAHILQVGSPTPSDLAMAALVGLLGAIVALGPAWIVLSILGFVRRYYQSAASLADSARHRRQLEREKKEADRKQQQEQIEWERGAPERERATKEEADRRAAESKNQVRSQKRRVDARADSEMLYQLYAVDISHRFPRESLDEWITKYMGDGNLPDEVEERGEQLRKIILHHYEQEKPTPKFKTLQELATWTNNQKMEIESLPIEERLKRHLLANLNVRNAELMAELMDEM